jgi:hypothetical protein
MINGFNWLFFFCNSNVKIEMSVGGNCHLKGYKQVRVTDIKFLPISNGSKQAIP